MLNGTNSKMLHRITGKSIREEASHDTRTFDLVRWVRARRTQWLGHILRMDESRMVHKAVKLMHASRAPGDLLMDAPDYSWEELKRFASSKLGRVEKSGSRNQRPQNSYPDKSSCSVSDSSKTGEKNSSSEAMHEQ